MPQKRDPLHLSPAAKRRKTRGKEEEGKIWTVYVYFAREKIYLDGESIERSEIKSFRLRRGDLNLRRQPVEISRERSQFSSGGICSRKLRHTHIHKLYLMIIVGWRKKWGRELDQHKKFQLENNAERIEVI